MALTPRHPTFARAPLLATARAFGEALARASASGAYDPSANTRLALEAGKDWMHVALCLPMRRMGCAIAQCLIWPGRGCALVMERLVMLATHVRPKALGRVHAIG